MKESHEDLERGVFTSFLRTLPALRGQGWRYEGAGHDRPDFVLVESRIGVELGEWLNTDQTRMARELDRLENDIVERVRNRRLTELLESFDDSAGVHYAVQLRPNSILPRRERESVIEELIGFLVRCRKPTRLERDCSITFGQADLPPIVASYFAWIQVARAEHVSFGIQISRGGAFDPEEPKTALLNVIQNKVVNKRELYLEARARKSLRELWLLIYCARGFVWNEPYHGIGLREGRPLDEATSRQILARDAHEFVANNGAGAFERVYLMFDLEPDPDCRLIWSSSARDDVS